MDPSHISRLINPATSLEGFQGKLGGVPCIVCVCVCVWLVCMYIGGSPEGNTEGPGTASSEPLLPKKKEDLEIILA